MIQLCAVTKISPSQHDGPKLAFYQTTVALPTDRRVAILGGRRQGKTLLLRLMAGMEAPDEGEVISPLELSPIANSRSLFHPRLSCLENVRLIARMTGIDPHRLALAVNALCDFGLDIEKPLTAMEFVQRQRLEVAVLSILSFDCYLLDDAHQIPKDLLEHYFDAAEKRGAGMIFTTAQPRQVQEYADYAIVIRNCTARAFNQVEDAIKAYEQ